MHSRTKILAAYFALKSLENNDLRLGSVMHFMQVMHNSARPERWPEFTLRATRRVCDTPFATFHQISKDHRQAGLHSAAYSIEPHA
jgi:hypothetical protein